MNPLRRLIVPVLFLFVVILIGILGFAFIEHLSFIDSLYMVIITLSTVGFREVKILSDAGKLFTIGLIICGVSAMAYTLGQVGEMMIEGQIVGYRRRRRMEKKNKQMKDHYIICGFGRVGHQVAEEFKEEKISYVVIDAKAEIADELSSNGAPYVIGDITSDETLEEAGVKQAKVLICCEDSDANNVLIILSARALNPKLYIIARASRKEAEDKLRKAGADKVILPYFLAGRRMASLSLRPVATDFVDTIMSRGEVQLAIKEFQIDKNSSLVNKKLEESSIRKDTGATVLAIRKKDGSFDSHPGSDSKILEGDTLVLIGMPDQLAKLEGGK